MGDVYMAKLAEQARTFPNPPTHNRDPYDTLLSDTMVTHPSVELMPLGSTRFM